MISLKRYLDSVVSAQVPEFSPSEAAELLNAYRLGLAQMADCGADTCSSQGTELKMGMARIDAMLGERPGVAQIVDTEKALRDLLQAWGQKAAQHYRQKAGEVKDLLLVMARTAQSLGHKDERFAQQFDSVTAKLNAIASLEDITTIRASVEQSARELRTSVMQMTAESKAVVEHLRAEVVTYQAKLEKAECAAACDGLTGLGSRLWAEGRIQERIDLGSTFSILMINIEGFHCVSQKHGNLTGDLLLKEFARELRSCCRFYDLVARWGSDQFLVVLDCAGAEARVQGTRLHAWISKCYHVPGRTGYVKLPLDATLGLAEFGEGDTLQALLERADADLCGQRKTVRAKLSA